MRLTCRLRHTWVEFRITVQTETSRRSFLFVFECREFFKIQSNSRTQSSAPPRSAPSSHLSTSHLNRDHRQTFYSRLSREFCRTTCILSSILLLLIFICPLKRPTPPPPSSAVPNAVALAVGALNFQPGSTGSNLHAGHPFYSVCSCSPRFHPSVHN